MANFNWAQMLFDEPNATQGFRTTGSDPLNQIASWYQFGQNLRQGADARRARKDAEDMARNEANGYRSNNPQAAIGVDANGVYGVNGSPAQPSGGIGVDASGVYGVNGTQQPSFNGGGGFDWSKASPMPSGDSVMGAWGSNGNSMFNGLGNKESDNNMNITSQTIGQNYNGRIDGQVGGLNIPRSPQGDSWGQALGNAENNSFSNFTGGSLANFQNPASSVDQAQVAGGATNLSADNPFARSARYLNEQYDKMAYVKSALDSGVKNPLVAMAMYDQMIAPLRESAKDDELRNAFFVLQNPESSDQDKMNAVALIQYYKKDPYMAENQQMKRDKTMYDMGYLPEGDFGYGDTNGGGSDFVNKVRNLQGKIGYRAPDGTNCMRTLGIALQGTPYEGQINVDQAVNTAKEHGDLHVSGDGYTPRAGDIAVVNDGNHAVMLTEKGGTIQNGSSHDGVYEDPRSPEEMFGGVKYWISSSRYGRGRQGYRRDPYRVSQREKFDYAKQQDAMNYALRNRAIDARLAAKTGVKNGKINSTNGLWSSDDDIVGIFNKNALKENPASGQAMLSIVGQFAPKYRELVQRGLPPEQAKGAIQAALIKQLGADNIANMGKERFNDMMDSIINGTSSVAQQKGDSGHGGASGSNDGSVVDKVKAKGWDVIKNMIPENRENLNPDPYRNDVEDTAFEKADARRRLIEAARKEGLEFDEYTNELRPIGGRWGNLFNSREKQEEINRKIASFKSRYAI